MRVLAFAVLAILTVALSAAADGHCKTYAGHFVATTESPCLASPVLLCTHGTLTGDLPSTYDFVMTSQTPLTDLSDPAFLVFTGDSVITTDAGRMLAHDTGKMWMDPSGVWPFETTVNIHSGDGAWEGATGRLVATGALDHHRGVTEGEYVGHVCVG